MQCKMCLNVKAILFQFFARKTSILTLVGFKHVRWHVTTFPDVLKSISESKLLAGIQRYFLASLLRCGKSI